jgi:hypothetical protein
MGYNIEVSFNVLKNGSVTKLIEYVKNNAEENLCDDFYHYYEFENKVQFQRRHCMMIIYFSQINLNKMIKFLNYIRNINELYVETIYNDYTKSILFASKYFLTQKMDKHIAKNFKNEKRAKIYTDDENMILNTLLK